MDMDYIRIAGLITHHVLFYLHIFIFPHRRRLTEENERLSTEVKALKAQVQA